MTRAVGSETPDPAYVAGAAVVSERERQIIGVRGDTVMDVPAGATHAWPEAVAGQVLQPQTLSHHALTHRSALKARRTAWSCARGSACRWMVGSEDDWLSCWWDLHGREDHPFRE